MSQTFSPSEAALSVFELTKRQPQFVMRFALISAAVMLFSLALIASTGVGEAMLRYVALTSDGNIPSMDKIRDVLSPAMPGFGILMVVNLVVGSIVVALGLRKAVKDVEVGPWGLQLGVDEIRLITGSVLFFAILMGLLFVFSFAAGLLAAINPALSAIGFLGLAVASVVAFVRFGQFGVMSVVASTTGVRESWTQTQGRFWRYFGAYALWMVLTIIAGTLVQAIATVGAMALGTKIGSGIPQSLEELLSVGWFFYILVYGMVSGFLNLGFICIGAYAWHQSNGDLPPPKTLI
jgi:hypothetical protein